MAEEKMTIGKAIDVIENALVSFDAVDQATILTTVCSHLKIAPGPQLSAQRGVPQNGQETKGQTHMAPVVARAFDAGVDIKSLKSEKKPSSASQMACVVAYYLSEHAPENERKDTIKSADLEKYFKQANYRLPEKMEQLLVDAKRSGYFENVGRGEYKLTRVGYNLVTQSMPASKDAR